MKRMKKGARKSATSGNITKERLAGTPFNSATEMNAVSDELRREAWTQLEKARIKRELLAKEEYKFFLEPFQKGMICKYGKKNDSLVRVYLSDNGIEVDINGEMKSSENSGTILKALIRSTSDSLFSNYLKSMDIINNTGKDEENDNDNAKRRRRSKK